MSLRPSKWRGRPVQYRSGTWREVQAMMPTFAMEPFAVGKNYPENPHLRSIVRQPMHDHELPIPVGVVSPAYALVQHHELGCLIVESLQRLDLFYDRLRCEVGMTQLGEWMTLRFYMGDDYSLTPPDGHPLDLRIETVNSVDGSGKLILLMSWFRLICERFGCARHADSTRRRPSLTTCSRRPRQV